ncbi:hypothetical protein OP10G_4562 [Fimbriimonas ginsengisoli Gsoil 348]|uniref:Uncharacterized protein n=1 Tax=Fimbriimonas ginsengisoli Gsoil 348 TaxID=661478 RepID=A0A068NY89_FIMGI|nr:hypothetical protein OP10G_4562 [Fimbriimonas ginsengisoli Gsoil 348]
MATFAVQSCFNRLSSIFAFLARNPFYGVSRQERKEDATGEKLVGFGRSAQATSDPNCST